MPRELSAPLRDELKWLCRLLLEKGDGDPRHVTKLMQGIDTVSPVLDTRVRQAVDNCLSPGAMHELPQDDKNRLGELLADISDWRQGKEAGYKQQMNLRVDTETRKRLAELAEESGETESEVIRRLIRQA